MPETREVQAQVKSGDRANEVFTVKYEMPTTIDEAREMWGDEVVFSQLMGAVVISLQSYMRQQIQKDNATADSVQEACSTWTPKRGRGPARPISERAEELLKKMDPETREALLREFLANQGAEEGEDY